MKAFVIHTRQVPGCACKAEQTPLFLVEVEGEMVTPMEDPSVGWLPKGEFMFRIAKPPFLHEPHEVKKADGTKEKVMLPAVYHSHAIFLTEAEALESARKLIRYQFEFEIRKQRLEAYTER